jgi:hypothetical protein
MNVKEHLLNTINDYSIILNDFINKDFIHTYDSEYLDEKIKVVSASLLETIEELKEVIYDDMRHEKNND